MIARSASYVRTVLQNSSVCVCVCVCVRRIIDFCRKDMNPRHVLLSTDTLKTRFWRFQKKLQKLKLSFNTGLFGTNFRTTFWRTFGATLTKTWPIAIIVSAVCGWAQNECSRLWRQVHVVASDGLEDLDRNTRNAVTLRASCPAGKCLVIILLGYR